MLFPDAADFPERLQAMLCGDESLVACDREQRREVAQEAFRWVAPRQIAQDLSSDRTAAILAIVEPGEELVPNGISPTHRLGGQDEELLERSALHLGVVGPQVLEILWDGSRCSRA